MAISGNVPVKVSTLNGPIQVGDPITSSEIAGFGIKATRAGSIVAKALAEFDPVNSKGEIITCPQGTPEGVVCGQIMAFVNVSWHDPDIYLTDTGNIGLKKIASPAGGLAIDTYQVLNTTTGEIVDRIGLSAQAVIGSLKAGLVNTQDLMVDSSFTIGGQSLSDYIIDVIKNNQITLSNSTGLEMISNPSTASDSASVNPVQGINLSEIYTDDRIATGLEIISPRVLTETLAVDKIEPSTGKDITMNLDNEGKFIVKNSQEGGIAITFDSQGNAFFAGELTADKIRTKEISGLEPLTTTASSSAEIGSNVDFENARVKLDLAVLGKLTVQGGLTVESLAEFKGETIFEKLTSFLGDVFFIGRPTFNRDTAGFAVIKKGQRKVNITFEKEYLVPPVVTTNLVWDIDDETISVADQLNGFFIPMTNFVITKATTKGFSILLDEPAIGDAKFSWIALAVKDVKTFESGNTILTPIPSPTINLSLPTNFPTPTVKPDLTPTPSPVEILTPIPESSTSAEINP